MTPAAASARGTAGSATDHRRRGGPLGANLRFGMLKTGAKTLRTQRQAPRLRPSQPAKQLDEPAALPQRQLHTALMGARPIHIHPNPHQTTVGRQAA